MKPTQVPFKPLFYTSLLLLLGAGPSSAAPEATDIGRLKHVGSVNRDDLQGVVGVAVSADARHLYAAAFHLNTVTVFRRDVQSGLLTHVQTLQSDEDLHGVTSIRLSPDGRHAVAAAFRSGTVVLYERNAASGELKALQTLRNNRDGVTGLAFAIRAKFPADGRHVYVLDGGEGGVTAFELASAGNLKWLQTTAGEGGALGGSRGLCLLPDGKTVITANYRGNSVAVLDRNAITGATTVRQVVQDGVDGVQALAGAFGVAASADGKFVYVCSGRFGGDQAVCAFQVTAPGKLTLLQEFMAGRDAFEPFRGGNDIVVSPEGRTVYATATESGSLACFAREPDTGKLRLIETLKDGAEAGALGGAAGVECSPDGRFVYVAAEFKQTLSIYQRTQADRP